MAVQKVVRMVGSKTGLIAETKAQQMIAMKVEHTAERKDQTKAVMKAG